MDQLDKVFEMFFYSLCNVAKWIFAIKMATNLIKDFEANNVRNLIQNLVTGGFAYGALYSIIKILDSVEGIVK
jgi:hypothetical protein